MNLRFKLILLFFTSISYSQEFYTKEWLLFKNENIKKFTINKSGLFKINDYTFYVIWDDKLSHDKDQNRYYSGIRSLKITKNEKTVNIIEGIVDEIGFGSINFSFYDYNFDGYLDFTIPKDCAKSCFVQYYLFSSSENKFQHIKSWDYLRIQRINKEKKLILTQPDGTASDGWQYLYQIKGYELIEIDEIIYGTFFKELEKNN